MSNFYEKACKEAGLSEEKTAEICRYIDAEKKKLRYKRMLCEENGVFWKPLDELTEEKDEIEFVSDVDVEDEVIRKLELMSLREHLQALEEKDRTFLLKCFDGTTERELAESMGITRGALRRKRDSLLRRLREKMGVNV